MTKQNTKKQLESKLLNSEQSSAVISAIISSMRESYTNVGTLPGDGFNEAARLIATKVVEDAQKALLQSNVYKNVAESTKPLLKKKKK